MKKSTLAILGLGAACSACCLPLLGPLLVALGLSGVLGITVGDISLDYVVCVLGPWSAGAGLLLWLTLRVARRRTRAVCDCVSTCPPAGC